MSDLKSKTRTRLLNDMIKSVKGTQWKVLIVDEHTMRIISAACRMYDILELGISLVEKIDAERQAIQDLDAIYFLSPTKESVSGLVKDFSNPKKTQYNSAFVFFASRVPDEMMAMIRSGSVLSKIKALKELNLDFLAVERRIFHFDTKDSFFHLFSPESTETTKEMDTIASRIVSVFATMKDNPIVRYSMTTPVSGALAVLVQEKLDQLSALSPEFANATCEGGRSVLLVLDRAHDLRAPLLHEFTYQSMVYDLLPIENDHYKYMTTTNIGQNKERDVILSEMDPLWPQLRHQHIADTMNQILDGFNAFAKENRAAQLVTAGHVKDDKSAQTKIDNLKEMSQAIKALPQFQEMLDKYSLHINMATNAMKEYETRNLAKLAALEQDIATQFDTQGNAVKNCLSRLPSLLQDPQITTNDRLRLLLLYVVSQEALKDQDRKRLFDLAGLTHRHHNALYNLKFMGLKIDNQPNKNKAKNKPSGKQRKDAPSYELSRFVPNVKQVVESLLNNELNKTEYPTAKSSLGSPKLPRSPKFTASLRKAVPKWAEPKTRGRSKSVSAGEDMSKGGRVVIFIAGGATYSEMRSVYELTDQFHRDIFLGSTHIITPDQFVNQLSDLKKMELLED